MNPISGFPSQVSSGAPAKEAQQAQSREAPASEPQDAWVPSDSLEGSADNLAIGDRGAMVREDLKSLDFLLKETEHFRLYYLPGTDAEREIEEIAANREQGFEIISDFLKVVVSEKISIYLFPSDKDSYCPTWGKTFAGRTIPEAGMIGLAYTADPESFEKVNFGHELTHALEFSLLPPGRRVPPFLREGIADYLCLSGVDMHLRLARFINVAMVDVPLELTGEKLNRAEYMESASFVEMLVSTSGVQAFLYFYRQCAVLEKGEPMTLEYISSLMKGALGYDLAASEEIWRASLKPYLDASVHPLPGDDELSRLAAELDAATGAADPQRILSLYSDDFYYRSPVEDRELVKSHLEKCGTGRTESIQTFDLGTWGYGKTVAMSTVRVGADEARDKRCFLAERLWGKWRLNPKIVGGWVL